MRCGEGTDLEGIEHNPQVVLVHHTGIQTDKRLHPVVTALQTIHHSLNLQHSTCDLLSLPFPSTLLISILPPQADIARWMCRVGHDAPCPLVQSTWHALFNKHMFANLHGGLYLPAKIYRPACQMDCIHSRSHNSKNSTRKGGDNSNNFKACFPAQDELNTCRPGLVFPEQSIPTDSTS